MSGRPHLARLLEALDVFRGADRRRRLAEVVAGALACLWMAAAVLLLVERGIDPGEATRSAIGGAVAAMLGAGLILGLLHVLAVPDRLAAAWEIERHHDGAFQARLATAVEFEGRAPTGAEGLLEACAAQAVELLADRDPARGVDLAVARRRLGMAGLVALLLWILGAGGPGSQVQLLARFLAPALGVDLPAPVRFRIQPGSRRVLAGSRFRAEVEVVGEVPGRLAVVRRFESGPEERLLVGEGETRKGTVDLGAVHEGFSYRFEIRPFRSVSYQVSVVDPPRPEQVRLRYVYPEYTGLPPRDQVGGDLDVRAPRGTRVEVEATVARPLRAAAIELKDGEGKTRRLDARLGPEGRSLAATLPVEGRGTWTLRLVDLEGFEDPAPAVHRLVADEDAPPKVYVLEPGSDQERAPGPGPTLDLKVHAADGFGVDRLTVDWVLTGRRGFKDHRVEGQLPVLLEGRPLQVTTRAALDLSQLELAPGDTVRYQAVARDARPRPEGQGEAGVTRSHAYHLRVPYSREEHAQVEQATSAQATNLEELAEKMKDWEERLDRTLRDVSADGEITWKERRELEALMEEQKQLRKASRELAAEMHESLDDATESGVMNEEAREQMEQVQESLRKAADEKMHQVMEQIRELMSQVRVDPGEVKEMRQRHKREATSKSLERMLEAMKKLKALQDIEKARNEADSLAKEQEELLEEVQRRNEEGESPEDLAARQDELEDRAEALADELTELQQRLEEEGGDSAQEVETARDQLNKGDSALQRMQESSQALSQKQGEEAESPARKAAQKLRQARDALRQAGASLQSQRRSVNLERIVAMVRLGLAISDREEGVLEDANQQGVDLKKACRRLAFEQDILYRGAARFEGKFEEALEDELEMKEKFMTAVADIVDTLHDAKDAFEQVRPFSGRQLARNGLEKLNQVMAQLLDVQEEIQDEMSQSSMQQMMEDLQRMIDRQKKLNQQTEKLKQKPGEAEKQRQMRQQMAQELGDEQGRLKEMAEKLRAQAEERGKLLGDPGELAKEMAEVEEALRAMEVGEETRQRQKRIVTRMLDMAQSLHKEGESKEREAKAPSRFDPLPAPSAPPDLAEVRRRFFENREREGFPLEDEDAVRGYLDDLATEDELPEGFVPPPVGGAGGPDDALAPDLDLGFEDL